MVVDLAHPDCGLLSLSVGRPLSEQSRHREEGEGGGGEEAVEYSCPSAPHNLGVWRVGRGRQTDGQRQRDRVRSLLQTKNCSNSFDAI